tara:strand:+ start:27156 stop:27617 length:462 start_codon:yes stop_codon:yes gene_type:complete
MKKFQMLLMLIALALFTACSSSSSDDDGGGNPNPNPNPTTPDFTVRVVVKTSAHPYFQVGQSEGYTIDGEEGKELTLTRGTTYTFGVNTPSHPFYISTSTVGNGAGEVTDGVTNSMTTNGTLSFTPNGNHPDLLYYQCGVHDNVGWKINIVDP